MLSTLTCGATTATTNSHVSMMGKPNNGVDGFVSDGSLDEEPQVRMRVGEMYQAKVPPVDEIVGKQLPHSKEGILIWCPSEGLSDHELNEFCEAAKVKHQYNTEQALGMLFWHKHDVSKSLSDMQNFTPMPDEWSAEDKVLFEQAYNFHGKNFRKIQQLVPDKEMGQLVKHYYIWKNSRLKTSLMDKHAGVKGGKGGDGSDGEGMDLGEYEDNDDKMRIVEDTIEVKHKLPKGIDLSVDDITTLGEHPGSPHDYISTLEENIVAIKRQVQSLKQECGQFDIREGDLVEQSDEQVVDGWTNTELLLAVKAVRKFGQNYESIAGTIGTKSVAQIKNFFSTYKNELKLDEVLKEHKEKIITNGD